jgi:hypothetical protein
MTDDDIMLMALDAGPLTQGPFKEWCKRFAALVAAHEREACAKECEHTSLRMGSEWMAAHCAAAIRARGNT